MQKRTKKNLAIFFAVLVGIFVSAAWFLLLSPNRRNHRARLLSGAGCEAFRIRGVVVDEEGRPVQGYGITLTLRKNLLDWSGEKSTVRTDEEGAFSYDSSPVRAKSAVLRGVIERVEGRGRYLPERPAIRFERKGGVWMSLRQGKHGQVNEPLNGEKPLVYRVRTAGDPVRLRTMHFEDHLRGAGAIAFAIDLEAERLREGPCAECDLRFEMSGIGEALSENGSSWQLTIQAGDGAAVRPSALSDPAVAPEAGYEERLILHSPPSRRGWMDPLRETVIFSAGNGKSYGFLKIEAGPWKSPPDVFAWTIDCRWNPHGGRSLYDPTEEKQESCFPNPFGIP